MFESNAREKPMEKVHSTVMSQRLGTEGDTECSRSFGHPAEPYLKGRVQRKAGWLGNSASLARSNDVAVTLHAGFRLKCH